jgi:hypothetical protein
LDLVVGALHGVSTGGVEVAWDRLDSVEGGGPVGLGFYGFVLAALPGSDAEAVVESAVCGWDDAWKERLAVVERGGEAPANAAWEGG